MPLQSIFFSMDFYDMSLCHSNVVMIFLLLLKNFKKQKETQKLVHSNINCEALKQ
jgi:hypothetical protein